MKTLQDSMSDDQDMFGPGTDLVVSLVAILVVMLSINVNAFQQKGKLNIQWVKNNQMDIINKIAEQYHVVPQKIIENYYGIQITKEGHYDIVVENDVTLQRIRFGSHILFDEDDDKLNDDGIWVLSKVGIVFKEKLETGAIKEIQIQGHADSKPSTRFSSNLELAAHRAIAVFEFLQDKVEINPAHYIMSITSFGEYKPVNRRDSDIHYNRNQLIKDNLTDGNRNLNRRIEVVLIHRQKQEIAVYHPDTLSK